MQINNPMKSKLKACCIVDPYVSSQVICAALLEKNIYPIAILTDTLKLSEEQQNHRFKTEHFKKIIHFKTGQTIQSLAAELHEFDLLAVIAGNERTCDMSDKIAEQLSPQYCNSIATSPLRMDKFEMLEGLRHAGLPSIHQMKITTRDLTDANKKSLSSFDFPVIVKPTNQSGSIGVTLCKSLIDVQEALNHAIGMISQYGNTVDACVIQECLIGDEYFVDTVSYAGQHKIVGIYRYQKIIYENKSIYQYAEAIEPQSPHGKLCSDYVRKVLSALEYNYGMAHTEFFLTESGLRLMELNPRISGIHGQIAQLASFTSGKNQAQLFAESLSEPDTFLSNVENIPPLISHGRLLLLNCWKTKVLKSFRADKLKNVSSYKSHLLLKKMGEQIKPPKELHDTIATVILLHSNEAQLNKDCEEITELEKNDLLFE